MKRRMASALLISCLVAAMIPLAAMQASAAAAGMAENSSVGK